MKKVVITLTLILAIGMLLFFGCSKETNINVNKQQPAQDSFEQKALIAIKEFKQKVAYYNENPLYKSGETISADSVLFLLETTMNYSHAFMMDNYEEELIENLTLTVPKATNDDVDMDVLIQKYLEMKAEITTVYHNCNFENKGLVAVDLSEFEQNGDEIIFSVDVITGKRANQPPPNPGVNGPFIAGDNWWYGDYAGKCYDTITGSDAAEQLSSAMSVYMYNYNQSHGIFMFSPVQVHKFQGGEPYLRRPNDIMDNHLDYYLYNALESIGISDDTLCVEWTEMNIYYQYLRYWLYGKMMDSLKSVFNICYHPALIIDFYGEPNWNLGTFYHRGYFLFGKPWFFDVGEGPEEL